MQANFLQMREKHKGNRKSGSFKGHHAEKQNGIGMPKRKKVADRRRPDVLEESQAKKKQIPFKKESKDRNDQVVKKATTASSEKRMGSNFPMRLNKYLAHSGVASRREADKLIQEDFVTVNSIVVNEMGHKVNEGDQVTFKGKLITPEKLVYVLLNKPKDFITTADDPQGRRTVMDLVAKACNERIFPVGRLDRMTTGLLLLTNDGDLAKKLTHPSHETQKIYQVETDRRVTKQELEKLLTGIELEDGTVHADKASYVGDGENKRMVGVELHSGKNRVIRRMFAALDHEVVKLDRVYFAGLTKRDLPRGRYRHLTKAEIGMLKMIR